MNSYCLGRNSHSPSGHISPDGRVDSTAPVDSGSWELSPPRVFTDGTELSRGLCRANEWALPTKLIAETNTCRLALCGRVHHCIQGDLPYRIRPYGQGT